MNAIRDALRDQRLFRAPVIRARMLLRPRPVDPGGVLFLMYHRVPARHCAAFRRQVLCLQSLGELVGVPEAMDALFRPPNGTRRICLTFDDGWGDAIRNTGPILAAEKVPGAFFVVSDWVGARDRASWYELRALHAAGMTIGSHSVSHPRFAELGEAAALRQLHESRDAVAQQMNAACDHFAAPFGLPNEDFVPERDPALAQRVGYRSFFTTDTRRAMPGRDLFVLPRIRMEPHWGRDEIAYALWR